MSLIAKLSFLEPYSLGEKANPFSSSQEILPEWYFFTTFSFLCILLDKLIGIFSMLALPLSLMFTHFLENTNKYQNLFRRPVSMYILFSLTPYSFLFSFDFEL